MPLDPGLEAELKKRGLSSQRSDTVTEAPAGGGLAVELERRGLDKEPSLWDDLKNYIKGSAEGLKMAGREIPQEAGRLAGNVAKGLMPGPGGARAGGEALQQLGDIGTFASGGLTNPLSMPQQAGGLARGMEVQPRVPPAPPSRLALPAPSAITPPPGAAGPSPAPPGQPLGLPRPSVAGLLPAPGMQVPGAPWASTGQGMIPPGPGSIMRPSEPIPSLPPTQVPRPAAPEMGPQLSALDTTARPGAARTPPAAPLVRPGAEEGAPSAFAQSIAKNDPTKIDKALTKSYRRAINPARPGQMNREGLSMQDQRITTAVDSIIDAKDSLKLKDANGAELPPGRLPRTLDEFVQAINYLKNLIFEQYDNLAKQQGGQGIRVPLKPAIERLQMLAAQPTIRDVHPGLAAQADELAQTWAQRGSYSPKEMQNVVQDLNEQLRSLQRNPTKETYSHSTMMNQVLETLRGSLNQTMETALQGPQYQALRNRYGALSSIEGDVANALRKHAAAEPGGGWASHLTDTFFWQSALHGAATLNPHVIGTAAATKAAQVITRYLRSPNRAITNLFSKRAADLSPTMTERLSARAAVRLGELRQQRYDANVRGDLTEFRDLGKRMEDYR